MVEQAMIFALGFLLAGLLALTLVPAFWRRAVRLTHRRIEAQVPVSIQEILAGRDQLRAQNAVECRRLEDRAAALNRLHIADMSELGRRAARIVGLENELAALGSAHREQVATNKQLERELAEASAQVAAAQKALFDAGVDYSNKREEIRLLNEELDANAVLAEVRLASLGAVESHATDLEKQLAALRNHFIAAQNRLRDKTHEVEALSDQLGLVRSDHAIAQKRLEAEAARGADLIKAANVLRTEQATEAAKLRNLNLKIESGNAELREMRRREGELLAKQAELAAKIRDGENRFDEQIQRLRSGNSALQGALDVARRRCDELENEMTSLRRNGAAMPAVVADKEEIILLRQSINDIGAAMIKLARATNETAQPTTAAVPEANGNAVLRILANGEAAREVGADPHSRSSEERDGPGTSREVPNRVEI